jgi:hypothetical protein
MVHKFIEGRVLREAGYHSVGMGTQLPSYCEICDCQRIHTCTGMKEGLYRFECNHCKDRLDGRL